MIWGIWWVRWKRYSRFTLWHATGSNFPYQKPYIRPSETMICGCLLSAFPNEIKKIEVIGQAEVMSRPERRCSVCERMWARQRAEMRAREARYREGREREERAIARLEAIVYGSTPPST
jgi:hypothetical protein